MAQDQPTRSVRLVFTHDGDDVRLVGQLPVEAGGDRLDTSLAARPGHYVELRDEQATSLGRTALPQAFPDTVEVFPETPGEPILRVPAGRTGTFTVVVAAPAAASQVAVVRLDAPPEGGAGLPGAAPGLTAAAPRTTELASFALLPAGGAA